MIETRRLKNAIFIQTIFRFSAVKKNCNVKQFFALFQKLHLQIYASQLISS